MSLRAFDEKTLNTRYDNYLKKISAAGGKPVFSREWYLKHSIGSVAVKTSGIPGVYSHFYTAEVPKELGEKINFASAFGTFMVGSSADLVSAEMEPSHGNWITRILCSEKQPDFSDCEKNIDEASTNRAMEGKWMENGRSLKTAPSLNYPVIN